MRPSPSEDAPPAEDAPASFAGSWWAAVVSLTLCLAVLWPAVRGTDGFPLSNYPMFSKPKSTRAKVFHVLGISAAGQHRPLPPLAVGTDEIMQAYQTVKLAIRGGPSSARALCAQAAARVLDDDELADITALQVRIDVFDAVEYWRGERRPLQARVIAECPVGGEDR